MKFIRIGGLSSVKYKSKYKTFTSYHDPPKKHGIFAFIYPYTDQFLWAWKIKFTEEDDGDSFKKKLNKFLRQNKKIFKYEGFIWIHICEESTSGKEIGSWREVHTSELKELFNKIKHKDMIELSKDIYKYYPDGCVKCIKNPYKRGLGGFMSIDHLEVFIEKKYLGKIR